MKRQAYEINFVHPYSVTSDTNPIPSTTLCLLEETVMRLQGDARGTIISCALGKLWITQEGDARDYLVEPGQEFSVTHRGAVVVQAVQDSRIQIGTLPPRLLN